MADLKTGAKFIEKDPPLADQETKSIGRKILDYLAYLKEQLNFIFSNYGRRLTDADGHINELTRTAEETTSVIYDPQTGLISKIQQNADAISAEVTRATGKEGDLNTAIGANTAAIAVNANAITTKVSTSDYNGNEIVSKINQTATTVDISADKINLNGAVTANNNVQILQDGTIKAVNADLSGKFTMTAHHEFKASDYSQTDVDRINEIASNNLIPTNEEFEKYDFNGDGEIDLSDAIMCRNLVLGVVPGNKITRTLVTKIDPSNGISPVNINVSNDYNQSTNTVDLNATTVTAPTIIGQSLIAGSSSTVHTKIDSQGVLVNDGGILIKQPRAKHKQMELTSTVGLRYFDDDGALATVAVDGSISSGGAGASGSDGLFRVRDASNNSRGTLTKDALTFNNTSGTQTAKYPASLTASKALVTGTNGAVTTSSVTSTELGYLSGVTSAVQTQIGNLQTQINNISISPTHLSGGNTSTSYTAGTYKYSGVSFTVPAGKYFVCTAHAYYSAVSPSAVCISNSSTSLGSGAMQIEGLVDSQNTRARVTWSGYLSSATTYYIWAKSAANGVLGVGLDGFYL